MSWLIWFRGPNLLESNVIPMRGDGASLIDFDTASPYIDTIVGPAASYSYRAAYRGTRADDEGASSAESTVATGAV